MGRYSVIKASEKHALTAAGQKAPSWGQRRLVLYVGKAIQSLCLRPRATPQSGHLSSIIVPISFAEGCRAVAGEMLVEATPSRTPGLSLASADNPGTCRVPTLCLPTLAVGALASRVTQLHYSLGASFALKTVDHRPALVRRRLVRSAKELRRCSHSRFHWLALNGEKSPTMGKDLQFCPPN